MLCVILGHSALTAQGIVPSHIAGIVVAVCFSFHMPLFFILSGYFMHPDRRFRWVREAKELLLTYAVTAAAVVVGGTVVSFLTSGQMGNAVETGWLWLKAAVYGAGDLSPLTLWPVEFRIGALWFLLALFWGHLFLHLLYRLRGFWRPAAVLACFVIGYASARFVWLPLSLQSGMCAVLFLYVGHVIRKRGVLAWMIGHPWVWALLGAVWLIDIWKFSGFSLAMNQYGATPVLSFVGSFAGTFCVIGLSMLVSNGVPAMGRGFAFCGRSSLALLCVHLCEDNIMPWGVVLPSLSGLAPHIPLTLMFFVVRLALDVLLALLLYRIPVVNAWFYSQLAARARRPARNDPKTDRFGD